MTNRLAEALAASDDLNKKLADALRANGDLTRRLTDAEAKVTQQGDRIQALTGENAQLTSNLFSHRLIETSEDLKAQVQKHTSGVMERSRNICHCLAKPPGKVDNTSPTYTKVVKLINEPASNSASITKAGIVNDSA